ncbi:MAG: hypothetical protein WBF34_21730 [Streptosporangiaceae bacterium]
MTAAAGKSRGTWGQQGRIPLALIQPAGSRQGIASIRFIPCGEYVTAMGCRLVMTVTT